MNPVRFFHRTLEGDLAAHEEAGWLEWGRETVPSLPNDPIVFLEWNGQGEPRLPSKIDNPNLKQDGKKDDDGKPKFSQIPSGVIGEVVAVLTDGAKRYGGDNWQRVPGAKVRYFDACQRHIYSWWEGEEIDPSSGRPHLAHAIANLMFLLWFSKNGTQEK